MARSFVSFRTEFDIMFWKGSSFLTSCIFLTAWECDENARPVPRYGTTRANVKIVTCWGCATCRMLQLKKAVKTPDLGCKSGNFGLFWGVIRHVETPKSTCRVWKLHVSSLSTSLVKSENPPFRVSFCGTILSKLLSFAFKTEVAKSKRNGQSAYIINFRSFAFWPLQPAFFLVPLDAGLDALFETPFRCKAKVGDGGLYLTLPVSLGEDVVLVVVQSVHLARQPAYLAANPANSPQYKERQL